MSSHGDGIIERLEERQFLSSAVGRVDGSSSLGAGAAEAETDEVESAGHRMDLLASERRAPGAAPPRPDAPSDSSSLHDALRQMAAAFEQTHGCAWEPSPKPLPWPERSRLDFHPIDGAEGEFDLDA